MDSPSQFGAKLSGQRVLQSDLKISANDNGKYFVGLSGAELKTIYFITSDKRQTWANGLDDKKLVSECISAFETQEQAHERANDFAHNSKYHVQDQSLELVLVATSSK